MPDKRRPVIWAPKAKQDLREVWRYYARVASPEIADKLVRDINQAGDRLAGQALMWRARDDVMPGGGVPSWFILTSSSIGWRMAAWKSRVSSTSGEISLRSFGRALVKARHADMAMNATVDRHVIVESDDVIACAGYQYFPADAVRTECAAQGREDREGSRLPARRAVLRPPGASASGRTSRSVTRRMG